jgi:hypothetical protein
MAEVRTDILRTVRVISAAYIRSQDNITKDDVLSFVRSLINEFTIDVGGKDILKARGIKILFADEEEK